MAQAGETPNLLNRLTDLQLGADRNAELPAHRDERGTADEPTDPGEPREIQTRGRTPAEVLGDREELEPRTPVRTADDDPKPSKTKEVAKLKFRGQELTPDELVNNPVLLDALIKTAEQFPSLQKKHQALLESIANKQLATETPAAPAAPQPTEQELREAHEQGTLKVIQAYKPMAEKEIAFYVKQGLIEEDMPDAYNKALVSLFSIFLYHLDLIKETSARTEGAIEWIKAEVQGRNAFKSATETKNVLDAAIDAVAARKEKVYEALRKPEVRAEFIKWLRDEVDPKVSAINEENIGKLWLAHNAEAILAFQNQESEVTPPARRRRAAGDRTSAAPGGTDPEPPATTLLDRLNEYSGRFPAEH